MRTGACADIERRKHHGLSIESWNRSPEADQGLRGLVDDTIEPRLLAICRHRDGPRYRDYLERFSPLVRAQPSPAKHRTALNDRMEVNFAFNSRARGYLIRGFRRRVGARRTPAENNGMSNSVGVICVSGELRQSNILLWPAAHPSTQFSGVLWPAFRRERSLLTLESILSAEATSAAGRKRLPKAANPRPPQAQVITPNSPSSLQTLPELAQALLFTQPYFSCYPC